MKAVFLRFSLGLILLLASGCSELPLPGTATPPEPVPTSTATLAPVLEATRTPVGPSTLRIWLPPQFDPEGDSPGANLLRARLDEFTARRSGVRVEFRIKSPSGPGGLLDSLSAANAAAPLALPDLILLPRAALETAALKGLLYPFDELTTSLAEDDWYPYAQQLAHLQNSTFGLPFTGDALVLVYRPAEIPEPPADWAAALSLAGPLAFPAADEQALYTLSQYLANGAQIQDEEGRPKLDATTLAEVLTFYQEAEGASLMPFWLTQYATDQQAWEAYIENRAALVVTWASRFLRELPVDSVAAPLPTFDGTPFTLSTGWVWALTNPQIERHALSVELAEFLTSGDFLARYTDTAGYLPPRSSALAGWSNPTLISIFDQVLRSAQVIPPDDVLIALSPALQQATLDVLKEQTDPQSAAQKAAEQVASP